jgi:hypothetical protein
MSRKLIFLFIFILFLSSLAGSKPAKIDSSVINHIQHSQNVKVIIKIQDKYLFKEVSKQDIVNLELNSSVDRVYESRNIHAFLQQSVPLINASTTQKLQLSGINLTGIGETVCVLDTGINFSHPDLIGKNKTCIIDCYNGRACTEDCSLSDDNGHGTHVAGIIAASGGITGVAPGASLIGLRVLNSGGGGSSNELDLSNAIDWCVAHQQNYNISVISMSLGTSNLYNGYCDGLDPWTIAINNATLHNISVVAATGNDGNYTAISAPACIQNVTAVGMTYDASISGTLNWGSPFVCADSSILADQIVCAGDRNNITDLFAPGALINSTWNNGSYNNIGGTSMAAPHVAGTIALMHQFLRLSNQTKSPAQIQSALNSTGKQIPDALSGLTFSRINPYSAILSLDNIAPNVTLVSPQNNTLNSSNQTFFCLSQDWQLSNVTFYLWNSSNILVNQTTLNITGTSNQTNFSFTNIPSGIYRWNCLSSDIKGNSAFLSSNYTIIINNIITNLISPSNNNFTNLNDLNFTCQSISALNKLSNVTFYLWNSSTLIYNQTKSISNLENTSIFNFTLPLESNYLWNCFSINNASNSSFSDINYSLTYDITSPNLTLLLPDDGFSSTSTDYNFTYNVSENSSCILIFDGTIINSINISDFLSGMYNSSLPVGTHTWQINCTDSSGNSINSSLRSFTILPPPAPPVQSPGGGGGGAPIIIVKTLPLDISLKQYLVLTSGKEINFTLESENHSITLDSISNNSITLTLRSSPLNLILSPGEEKKINLTSPDYYNLYLKLNSIDSGLANLSIQSIKELIEKEAPEINETSGKTIDSKTSSKKTFYFVFAAILIVLMFLGIWFGLRKH